MKFIALGLFQRLHGVEHHGGFFRGHFAGWLIRLGLFLLFRLFFTGVLRLFRGLRFLFLFLVLLFLLGLGLVLLRRVLRFRLLGIVAFLILVLFLLLLLLLLLLLFNCCCLMSANS